MQRIPTKFCTVTKTTKYSSWLVQNRRITNPKWRTAAIFKKSINGRISAMAWPICMTFGTMTLIGHLKGMYSWNFEVTAYSETLVENRRFYYPPNGWPPWNFTKIFGVGKTRVAWCHLCNVSCLLTGSLVLAQLQPMLIEQTDCYRLSVSRSA